MDKEAFRHYLKKRGKKDHVIDGLVRHVKQFEDNLARQHGKGLADADIPDLQEYAAALNAEQPGQAKKDMRALALYYHCTGNAPLSAGATEIREKGIAGARQAFKLRDFKGVDPDDLIKLAAAGIQDSKQMLAKGRTPEQRRSLAQQTGVSEAAILELVKLSDLSRLPGVKGIRARLYYDAGVDTVAKMASWEPEALYQKMLNYVNHYEFDGLAPLPKEVSSTIASARKLADVIFFEEG
jgi:hypothetical protein